MYQYHEKKFTNTKDLAMHVLSGKYKIVLIWCFLQQPILRLSEIEKMLPDINQRMLIRQLRELESDHLLTRKIYPVVPPKVEYQLTEIGRELSTIVQHICDWGDHYYEVVASLTIDDVD
ncbi:helix-turn-helix domain-containing protein [Enterococcus mundtii]|uniref:winged helix-turn-helix transcriptional regulator n=1 Tax=Enterococcus TaxID=1350 RepID=UPI00044A71F5|nr:MULTISPECIES: helix-turn-helix domain-containing protein [Enterococcus]AZP92139.1 transcriptional regulator [Enterococcus mundtii]EYT94695.1 transcriptional regulator [Enterococcus mundtii CRL35]MDA9429781.1 Transcriptional regulator HxlR, formaldehyde assimilation [Enterococcus mundtii 1A]MDK4211826.1 helix-turn-helix domain-containing protein [Enterococcus mundtii]MDO7879460.1 helix-turn-helix domain-containing protein [Enterococcus mundtii]